MGISVTRRMLRTVVALVASAAMLPALAASSPTETHSDAAALTQIAIAHYEHNDFGHAFDEFAEAAQRGNRLAQFNYAMMLMRGEGTVARPEEAVKWLRRAADNQMTHAQFAYGELYERGELVPRSVALQHPARVATASAVPMPLVARAPALQWVSTPISSCSSLAPC